MNSLIWFFLGYDEIEISGGSPQWLVNGLTKARIPFWNIRWLDPFHVRILCFRRDRESVRQIAETNQCEVVQVSEKGFFHLFSGVFHRPILLVMVLLGILGTAVLPQYLWFYEVHGNETIPKAQILRSLESLGIGRGLYGPEIDPKWIKDHMLQLHPELQWITVTQNGCKAQVVVRERKSGPATVNRRQYANVVASKSGLLISQSILAGQARHKPGDAVLKGELLVSGLVDLENRYLVTHAQAEIFARTWERFFVKTPEISLGKQEKGRAKHTIWLELGGRRIKIFGNSGISYASCDKMISRKILSLPGGSSLPLELVLETHRPYVWTEQRCDPLWTQAVLEDGLRTRLSAAMQAGTIRSLQTEFRREGGCYVLEGVAECEEMIAQTVEATWNEEDFKDD